MTKRHNSLYQLNRTVGQAHLYCLTVWLGTEPRRVYWFSLGGLSVTHKISSFFNSIALFG